MSANQYYWQFTSPVEEVNTAVTADKKDDARGIIVTTGCKQNPEIFFPEANNWQVEANQVLLVLADDAKSRMKVAVFPAGQWKLCRRVGSTNKQEKNR